MENLTCNKLFSVYDKRVNDETDEKEKFKYALLRDAASLDFNRAPNGIPDSQVPFRPLIVIKQNRTDALSDFDGQRLTILQTCFDEVSNPDLKARIADILICQLRGEQRLTFAKLAVENYLISIQNIDINLYTDSVIDRMARAVQIAQMFKSSDPNLIDVVTTHIQSSLEVGGDTQEPSIADLCKKMYWFNACLIPKLFTKEQLATYGDILVKICERLEKIDGGLTAAEVGYQLASQIFSDMDKRKICQSKLAGILKCLGDTCPSEGEKIRYYESALSIYRKLGSKVNESHLHEIQSILLPMREKFWSANMRKVEIRSDGTAIVQAIHQDLLNKSLKEKVSYLASFINCYTKEKALEFVNETKGELHGAISCEVIDADFRRVNSNQKNTSLLTLEDELQFKYALGFRAGIIEFIMNNFYEVAPIELTDINFLIEKSPWIPADKQTQIIRGLLAAFNNDWMMFGLFMIPMFESMLCYYLNQNGIHTFKQNQDGSQEECSLDELFTNDKVITLLGEAMLFELQFVLTNKTGYGIRHLVAHSKLRDDDYQSDGVKLFFWLIIKLLVERNHYDCATSVPCNVS